MTLSKTLKLEHSYAIQQFTKLLTAKEK